MRKYTRQDYSLIKTSVEKIKEDINASASNEAFYFLVLGNLFNLQLDEIQNCITDTHYLSQNNGPKGNDRGIDAIYIEETGKDPIIHLFNFKYSGTFEKTLSNFPSSEIDKILSFLSHLFEGIEDDVFKASINQFLYEKVKEIWELFNVKHPAFVIHLVSNGSLPLEKNEQHRFQKQLDAYSNIELRNFLAQDIVLKLTGKHRKIVDAKIQVSKKELFEQSGGDTRALIVNLSVVDCIRIVLNREDLRLETNLDDISKLTNSEICEDAFDDNVRVYLKQRPRINQNIKRTVLSDDSSKFFYYNNGITITCNEFMYNLNPQFPLIELKDIQVVNGSQTIHALYDALKEDYNKLENASVLCRIYEIKNKELSGKIAQFTNSQNPVNNRDIKSIDYVQLKLEQEFKLRGYFYERKKNQYADEAKNVRLDSEKVGQVLMSFYNNSPYEAKNSKASIFAEEYDNVFTEDIDTDKVLLAYKLFEFIEANKNEKRPELFINEVIYEEKSYIIYASLYILYFIKEIAKQNNIDIEYKNLDLLLGLYPKAIEVIEKVNKVGKARAKTENRSFAFNTFYKSPLPITIFKTLNQEVDLENVDSVETNFFNQYKLENKIKGLTAFGIPTINGFKVLAKSDMSIESSQSLTGSQTRLRGVLVEKNIVTLGNGKYTFIKDYVFSSSSLAANVINGYSSNGRITWKDSDGNTLKNFKNKT
ncbi:DUF4357 domain-containing protein [Pedobacter sp. LMG 31464]|uniref:DUF4357 domain-containing protein n=1 Tax=Pedobacter planticolens TaxID=2679964 RepID=A0A923DY31_9SPHI|nr:AIPR family protein [Pedobacter planticolens]MBB2145166.1 DUF4357 domain-containing protein [Pedobacter planticolens]